MTIFHFEAPNTSALAWDSFAPGNASSLRFKLLVKSFLERKKSSLTENIMRLEGSLQSALISSLRWSNLLFGGWSSNRISLCLIMASSYSAWLRATSERLLHSDNNPALSRHEFKYLSITLPGNLRSPMLISLLTKALSKYFWLLWKPSSDWVTFKSLFAINSADGLLCLGGREIFLWNAFNFEKCWEFG